MVLPTTTTFGEPTSVKRLAAAVLRRQLFLSEVREAEGEYQTAATAHFDDVEALLDELRH